MADLTLSAPGILAGISHPRLVSRSLCSVFSLELGCRWTQVCGAGMKIPGKQQHLWHFVTYS